MTPNSFAQPDSPMSILALMEGLDVDVSVPPVTTSDPILREADMSDRANIDAFLRHYPETSMFLRSNLAKHGIGLSAHAHATRFFIWEDLGAVLAVFGLTNEGFVLCQAPNCPAAGFFAFADAIKGEAVRGLNGPSAQVSRMIVALDLAGQKFTLNQEEPLMVLDLAELGGVTGETRAPQDNDVPLLSDWFYHFARETRFGTEQDSRFFAPYLALGAVSEGGLRLLIEDGTPVAMAGVNAIAENCVQVGGIFVPEKLRGRGLGGKVTAALLRELRDWGAHSAILFANNPAALRCYQKLGFSHHAAYRVAMLETASVIGQARA